MRNREERLTWVESLMTTSNRQTLRRNAAVIPSDAGSMAIEFPYVLEVVFAERMEPFAFLPDEFCGVVARGSTLFPIIDVGGDRGRPSKIVLISDRAARYGLRFFGPPHVIDLDAAEQRRSGPLPAPKPDELPTPLVASKRIATPDGCALLLDIEAISDTLLEE